jgi:hypothetical protein
MYNEQYAKGIVHLAVFAFLVVLSHASGIFGLFIAGWVFYMAIEAHHTAQAKRDGLPLPNPFGLNDIGERMGFQSWTTPQSVATAARDAAQAAGFKPGPVVAGAGPGQYGQTAPPPQPGAWGAPVDAYTDPYSVPPPPYTPPYTEQGWQSHAHQSYSQNYPPYGAPVPPYTPPYTPPYAAPFVPPPFVPPARNRFPAGAVWLIGLGALFLLGTENVFSGLRGQAVVGGLFIAFGGTLFARRFTTFDDTTASPQFRLFYALRVSVWLALTGVLILLDSFNIVYFSHSWPLYIILAGVMMLLNRAPFLEPYPLPPAAPAAPAPATPGSEMTRLNLEPDPPATRTNDTTTGGN